MNDNQLRFFRSALRIRRDKRDMLRAGWEFLGEGGGNLWELYRGRRMGHRITDVRIAACGMALWIKTETTLVNVNREKS